MSRVLVGPARSIRSATDGGRSGFLSCVLMGEESTVLLQPALRSTASPQTVFRRTIDPSPPTRGGRSGCSPRSAAGSGLCRMAFANGFSVDCPWRGPSSRSFTTARWGGTPLRLDRAGHDPPRAALGGFCGEVGMSLSSTHKQQGTPEPLSTDHVVPSVYSLARPRALSYVLNGRSAELEESPCRDEATRGMTSRPCSTR